MMIDSKRRYFRLTPKAVAVFEEHETEMRAWRDERIERTRQMLLELGVPEDAIKLGERGWGGAIGFSESMLEYIPKLLTKPDKYGWCRFKRNIKRGREIDDYVSMPSRIESLGSRLPGLGLNRCWLIPGYMVCPSCGRYGDDVVLINIMKTPDADGRIYEPDPELVEELTLSEWAAIVERVEGGGA